MIAETLIGQSETAFGKGQPGVGRMVAKSKPNQESDQAQHGPTFEQMIGLIPRRRTRWPRR